MFNLFEAEFNQKVSTTLEDLECIYSHQGSDDDENQCKGCGSMIGISDEGFNCCSNPGCGKMFKEVLDFGPEWRFYGSDDTNSADPARCGMPINPLLYNASFGCKIVCNSRSSYEMRKIRRYTEWQNMPYKEKSKYEDFKVIEVFASAAGIPKIIIEEAIRYYNKISVAKTYRGINRDGLLAASIYIACSISKNPRTAKEIATIFRLDNTSATRGCKNAVSILNELEANADEKTVLCNTTPATFIERYCSRLNMNAELVQLCVFIANKVHALKMIPENTPHSISAGIVYFVCQRCNQTNLTKKQISAVSKISEVTINKCFKKLESFQDRLIPSQILKKYVSV